MRDTGVNSGSVAAGNAPPQTQHALLVAWGHFARTTGMLDKMLNVPISQQARDTALRPAQKLIELLIELLIGLLIGLLGGIEYLTDLSAGAAPWRVMPQ